MKISELTRDYEFGDIIISGVAGNGKTYSNLEATISTVSEDGTVKVWPKQNTGIDDEKLWFDNSATIHYIAKDNDLLRW